MRITSSNFSTNMDRANHRRVDGEGRERSAMTPAATASPRTGACWIEKAYVTELTALDKRDRLRHAGHPRQGPDHLGLTD